MSKTEILISMLRDIARVKPSLMTDQNQIEVLVYPTGHNPSQLIGEAIEIYQRNSD
jgi:hypothetical protein